MTEKGHANVSTFTLDVYWTSGRSGDPELAAHVAACPRCQAYLEALDAVQPPALPEIAPPKPLSRWGRKRPQTPGPGGPRSRWRGIAVAAGGALALAASIVLMVRARPRDPDGYVGIKGTPAVELLVHRDRDTRIWDGRSPVRPGDAIALRVACEGLRHVTVAAPGPAGWMPLSSVDCPTQSAPLPFTLVVDGDPGDERLAVVLSQDALDDQALRDAIQTTRRTDDVWAVQFVLPKTTEVER